MFRGGGGCCPPMDLMRSETMQLVQVIIPAESARLAVSNLGDLGLVQFKDLNADKSPFQRTYAAQIKRCGEMTRKMHFFKEQMSKAAILTSSTKFSGAPLEIDDLEIKLGEFETELIEVNTNNGKLQRTYNELVEYNVLLQKTGEFFYSAQRSATQQQSEIVADQFGDSSLESPLMEQEMVADPLKQVKLGFLSGLVPKQKAMAFERILFRATRGNMLLQQESVDEPVTDPQSGEKVVKNSFVIFYSGERAKSKIVKICDAFGANRYPFPEDLAKQLHTIQEVQDALHRATTDSNSQVASIFQILSTQESPPTYFQTNKFTSSFQGVVDAYGIAKYQEANPGLFTIVTFPFLFAVMFGDWGHGICLLLSALYLIIREKKLASQKLNDIVEIMFGGRYVILMMSLFSIYTGLIYNEFFSVPFELFGKSAYACRDPSCGDATTEGLLKVRQVYPFGVDPVWHGSRSELPFLNSLKMKMSILLGLTQMNLGIMLSFFNAKFFKNTINVWYQFVPRLIFLNSLFGYLSILIIIKWCTGSKADLYHVMIYMFLSPTDDIGENQLFPGQKIVQPLFLKKQHEQRHQGQHYTMLQATEESVTQLGGHHENSHLHDEFEFSEVFIHQLIHTIEFVLGAVSNTASYLRLWALSLAHSELSTVFYDKVLLLAWGYNNIIILVLGVTVFLFATIGVLLSMETLSAFLHALRLHWVEFQDKFYEGDGYKFEPFAFSSIIEEED
ncbi:hypothetical protein ACQ4PT_063606 [Festuca glaucescens]